MAQEESIDIENRNPNTNGEKSENNDENGEGIFSLRKYIKAIQKNFEEEEVEETPLPISEPVLQEISTPIPGTVEHVAHVGFNEKGDMEVCVYDQCAHISVDTSVMMCTYECRYMSVMMCTEEITIRVDITESEMGGVFLEFRNKTI